MRLGYLKPMTLLSCLVIATSWPVLAQDVPNTGISIPSLPELSDSKEHMVVDPVSKGDTYIYEAGMENQVSILLIHGLGDEGSRNWSLLVPELAQKISCGYF